MLAPQLAAVSGAVATLVTDEGESEAISWVAPVVPVAWAWYHACANALRLTTEFGVDHVLPIFSCSMSGPADEVGPVLVPTYSPPLKVSICQARMPAPRSWSATGAPVPPGMRYTVRPAPMRKSPA